MSGLTEPGAAGAYGLTVRGLADPVAAGLNDLAGLGPADGPWPEVHVELVPFNGTDADLPAQQLDGDTFVHPLLGGGWLEVSREQCHAAIHLPRPSTERDLAHPLLGPIGATFAWWSGREAFHGAGFVATTGGGWAVAAAQEAGKSTLAACLALRGVPLLADDLLVLDHGLGTCFAGPRLVDLRPPAAAWLRESAGVELVDVRHGNRARLDLAPVPLVTPFVGFVLLVEGEELAVRSVPVAERMERLATHRGMRREPNDPTVFLDLATRPVLELTRPKDFAAMDDVIGLLLEVTGDDAGTTPLPM